MGIYQVVLRWNFLSQAVRNVFYFETTVGEPSTSEWQDICDEIRADVDANLKTSLSSQISFSGITHRRVDLPGYLSFDKNPTSGGVIGTGSSECLPTQIALLVSQKAETTRPNRTRVYLAGFPETSVTNGLFGTSARTAGENFVDFMSALNSAGTNPLQRVTVQWNTGHTAINLYNNVSGAPALASSVPATQRRRRIGVGI